MSETNAAVPNSTQSQSNNPWHHMKGVLGRMEIPGTILPRRWLRPYYFAAPHRIDDKQYVIESLSSLKESLHFFYGFLYIVAGGAALGWSATHFREDNALWVTLLCLAIAIPAHIYGRHLKQDRFDIYDRETGMLRNEYGWFKRKYHEIPFWECHGRLVSGPNHFGIIKHSLHFSHPTYGLGTTVVESSTYDVPLGYWSFLIQYMDKNKPLPDIPYLKDYPNRDPGLGDWDAWEEKMKKDQIVDPYAIWLTELGRHPEWDAANYGRDLSKHKRVVIESMLMFDAAILVVIGSIVAFLVWLF
jgi:hypothetical protein